MNEEKKEVKVVRYIRPRPFEWSKYGLYDNLYGITLVFTLNYETQMVFAQWSICNGDNFEKKIGVELAEQSSVWANFPISLIEEKGSLTVVLIESLLEYVGNTSKDFYEMSDFVDILELFLEGTRKLKSS